MYAAPCEHCSEQARLHERLGPVGDHPGYLVYHCESCDRFTWIKASPSREQKPQQPS